MLLRGQAEAARPKRPVKLLIALDLFMKCESEQMQLLVPARETQHWPLPMPCLPALPIRRVCPSPPPSACSQGDNGGPVW